MRIIGENYGITSALFLNENFTFEICVSKCENLFSINIIENGEEHVFCALDAPEELHTDIGSIYSTVIKLFYNRFSIYDSVDLSELLQEASQEYMYYKGFNHLELASFLKEENIL